MVNSIYCRGNFGSLLGFFFICGMILVFAIWGISTLFSSDEIRTNKPLVPKSIEIRILNGISDTTYIYDLGDIK